MSARVYAKVAGAVVAGAIGLVIATSWHDSPWSGRGCEGDCMVILSTPESILKISVAFLSLILVAIVTTRYARRLRVIDGAVACAASGALTVLITIALYTYLSGHFAGPDLFVVFSFGTITGLVGAFVSWGLVKWRPNKSLERTRER